MEVRNLGVVSQDFPNVFSPKLCSHTPRYMMAKVSRTKTLPTIIVLILSVIFEAKASPAVDFNSNINGLMADQKAEAKLISRNPDDIVFALYNDKTDKSSYEVLQYGNLTNITSSSYDPNRETKFLVHGFNTKLSDWFPQRTKDAYLNTPLDYNVIAVDWGKLATPVIPILYPLAVDNVRRAGVRIGEFITWLRNNSLIDLNKVHIVGFSLGAHVSGRAASIVKTEFNQSVARVTGLDPAGPEFYTGILARKLTPEDAAFVDVYHTSAGQLGIWDNVGQTDIYLNGGTGPQPGCLPEFLACSHSWAYKFFTNTIGNGTVRSEDDRLCACNDLLGYKLRSCACDKRITVGEYLQPGATGESYVDYRFESED